METEELSSIKNSQILQSLLVANLNTLRHQVEVQQTEAVILKSVRVQWMSGAVEVARQLYSMSDESLCSPKSSCVDVDFGSASQNRDA